MTKKHTFLTKPVPRYGPPSIKSSKRTKSDGLVFRLFGLVRNDSIFGVFLAKSLKMTLFPYFSIFSGRSGEKWRKVRYLRLWFGPARFIHFLSLLFTLFLPGKYKVEQPASGPAARNPWHGKSVITFDTFWQKPAKLTKLVKSDKTGLFSGRKNSKVEQGPSGAPASNPPFST